MPNKQEYVNFIGRLEDCYKNHFPEGVRPPSRETFVDSEGYGFWTPIYNRLESEIGHERATNEVLNAIHRIISPQQEIEPGKAKNPLKGRLRLEGKVFVDDSGPVLPLFCHFGEAFSAFVRTPDEVLKQLDVIAESGYQGIRFWDVLGYYDAAWGGKEITPIHFKNKSGNHVERTGQYYDKLESFLKEVEKRELKVMHDRGDLNSWTREQRNAHMREVGKIYSRIGPNVVAGMWACNEAAHNGLDRPEQAIEMVNAFLETCGFVPLLGLSDYDQSEGLEMLRSWSQNPASLVTIHGLRDENNRKRGFEHYFTNGYGACQMIGKSGWETEPIGPGSGVTVGQENDPEALMIYGVISLLSKQAYTYMSSNGVFWNGPLRQQAAKKAGSRITKALIEEDGEQLALARANMRWDFHNHQPGFLELPQMVAKLPKNLMTYQTIHHSGSNWDHLRVWIADDHTRCDGVQDRDGKFVYLMYGEHGVPNLPQRRNAQFEVIHEGKLGKIIVGRTV